MPVMQPNDAVAGALMSKGVPNTAENYKRMSEALRVGGWTGGNAPVDAKMMRTGRGYMPERTEPNALERMLGVTSLGGDEAESVDNPTEEGAEGVVPPSAPISVKDMSPEQYLDDMNSVRPSVSGFSGPANSDKVNSGTPQPSTPNATRGTNAPTEQGVGVGPAGLAPLPDVQAAGGSTSVPPAPGADGASGGDVAGGVGALLASIYGAHKIHQAMSTPPVAGAVQQTPIPQKQLPAPSLANRPADAGTKQPAAGAKYADEQKNKASAESKAADEKVRPYIEGQKKREANLAAKQGAKKDTGAAKEAAVKTISAGKRAARAGARRF